MSTDPTTQADQPTTDQPETLPSNGIERQMINQAVLPAAALLSHLTEQAVVAAQGAEVADAFKTVSYFAGLSDAAPEVKALLGQWTEQWQVTLDRADGNEKAGWLSSALDTFKGHYTTRETADIQAVLSAWKATEPKQSRTRGSGKKGESRLVQTLCHAYQKTFEDRTTTNSARWTLQGHMCSVHKWSRKWAEGEPAHRAITEAMDSNDEVTITVVDPDGRGDWTFTMAAIPMATPEADSAPDQVTADSAPATGSAA